MRTSHAPCRGRLAQPYAAVLHHSTKLYASGHSSPTSSTGASKAWGASFKGRRGIEKGSTNTAPKQGTAQDVQQSQGSTSVQDSEAQQESRRRNKSSSIEQWGGKFGKAGESTTAEDRKAGARWLWSAEDEAMALEQLLVIEHAEEVERAAMAQAMGARYEPDVEYVDSRVPPYAEEYEQANIACLMFHQHEASRQVPGGREQAVYALSGEQQQQQQQQQGFEEQPTSGQQHAPAAAGEHQEDHPPCKGDDGQHIQPGETALPEDIETQNSTTIHQLLDSYHSQGAERSSKLLRWVGYDGSAHAVAKTLVVAEMMRSDADVDAIIQVWYSAAWSHDTLDQFREAVKSVLTRRGSARTLGTRVRALLSYWMVEDVSLQEARQLWLRQLSVLQQNPRIANFKRKVDRMALCSYLLTGQVLDAQVRSVAMWAAPHGFGVAKMGDEHFLQTVPEMELFARMRQQPQLDIVSAGIEILRERIRHTMQYMQEGHVSVQIHEGMVESKNKPVVAKIRGLQANTISWSNCPDYCMPPSTFHALARACSSPTGGTVHMMHSMNWICSVKGTSHVDYVLAGKTEEMRDLAQQGRDAAAHQYSHSGLNDLLLSPPADIAQNLIEFALQLKHHKAWASAFFTNGHGPEAKRPAPRFEIVKPPVYCPVHRTSATVHIVFAYDDSVDLTDWL